MLERRRIRGMVSSASVAMSPVPQLTRVEADALVDVVVDGGEPWWRRRACARALAGRLPASRIAGLVACAQDGRVTTELRVALLELLAVPGVHADALLAWLRAEHGDVRAYGFDEAALRARVALADVSAAPRLAELAADAWTHRRAVGERGIDGLIAACGLEAVLAALGVDSVEWLAFAAMRWQDRLLGVRLWHAAGEDVVPALADASVIVARAACELVAVDRGDDEALWTMVHGLKPGHLWALAALHQRGHAIDEAWAAIGRPRVAVPGVPDEVRAAIVRTYTPGQRQTDPRWLLEAACLRPHAVDEAAQLQRVGEVLAAAGLRPRAPVAIGDENHQGEGTYHTIAVEGGAVAVSTLGPFVRGEGGHPRAIAALQTAGFCCIDDELAGIEFVGLHVYFFGAREPLSVADLLFYWQD